MFFGKQPEIFAKKSDLMWFRVIAFYRQILEVLLEGENILRSIKFRKKGLPVRLERIMIFMAGI